MKKLLPILFIAITNLVFAERITFPTPNSADTKPVKSSKNTEFISNVISEMDLGKITIQGQNFTAIILEGYVSSGEVGDPNLLGKTRLLTPPKGTTVEVRVLSSEYVDISLNAKGFNYPLMPVEPPHRKSDPQPPALIINAEMYSKTTFNQRDLVDLTHFGTMRDQEVFVLNISPIQYLPSENIIRVHYHIEFEVNFVGTMHTSPKNPARPKIYQIVAHEMFKSSPSLSQFITWKTEKGFEVRVTYTDEIGGTGATLRTNIKTYLQNIYDNLETRSDFLLLIGDDQEIPAWASTVTGSYFDNDHITDLYYAEYTGDNLPDIQYGRLSARNEQHLANQVEKILAMEKMNVPSLDFLGKATFVAGSEVGSAMTMANTTVNYAANNYWNSTNGVEATVFLSSGWSSGEINGPNFRTSVNEGRGFVNYTAHCDELTWDSYSFLNVSHVTNLTNENKYPLMIGNCCLSARFDVECIGEALVRAQRKGAVTYIGATNYSYWYEDFQWALGPMAQSVATNPATANMSNTGTGVYDRMWHTILDVPEDERAYTAGEIVFWGNMAVQLGSASSQASQIAQGRKYYWEIYHVLGDPSYVQSLKIPQVLNANHLDTLFNSIHNELHIETVPFAYVGFTHNGTLLGGGATDENGLITFVFDEKPPLGQAKLVITAKNHIPHIAPITILANPVSIAKPLPKQTGFDVMISRSGQLHVQINTETPLKATIRLTNSVGQPVRMIVSNETLNVGQNDFYFDMNRLPKGAYICTYSDGNRTLSQKIVW
jgi:hypothetical protein